MKSSGYFAHAWHGEASVQASPQSPSLHTDLFGCLFQRHRAACDEQSARGALVQSLLKAGRPSAILRRVGAVVVDAIDALSFGWFAHIGQKVREGIAPAVTDGDSTRPVTLEPFQVRVVAPVDHRAPDAIELAGFEVSRMAVRGSPLSVLSLKTAATALVPGPQQDGRCPSALSAVALAMPLDDTSVAEHCILHSEQHHEPTKALRGEVEKRWHASFYNGNNEDHCTCPVSGATPRMPGYQK